MNKKYVSIFVALILITGIVRLNAHRQLVSAQLSSQIEKPIIVDHNSIELFEQIPEEYLEKARQIRMVFSDRSVGQNINESLDCLTSRSWTESPSACRRDYSDREKWTVALYGLSDYQNGRVPEAIRFEPNPLKYNRSNITFEFIDSSIWNEISRYFMQTILPNRINTKDAFSFQFNYLTMADNSTVNNTRDGFFANSNNVDVFDIQNWENNNPDKQFVYMTSSLSRNTGGINSETFNRNMRAYAKANNKILLDVADIESHRTDGSKCFDNKDGVQYCTASGRCENNPDDGVDYEAICQDYTTETNGGHLGSVSGARIRIAKAFWVMLAQMAGWEPSISTTSPSPTVIVTESPRPTSTIRPTAIPTATSMPSLTPTITPIITPIVTSGEDILKVKSLETSIITNANDMWYARVRATIEDNDENLVSGAMVDGLFTINGIEYSAKCNVSTNNFGFCNLNSILIPRSITSVDFEVTGVSKDGASYELTDISKTNITIDNNL